jgi:uncharacterized membrane protein YedE/YeeE
MRSTEPGLKQDETMNVPAKSATVASSFLRGPRKPSRETAQKTLVVAGLVVLASVGVGVIADDMRPVVAAVYFTFGFALQRASFCSAALVSAVVLSRDYRGVTAIMIAVLTAMLGFGVMQTLGWITVYPGRVSVLPAAVGGLLYGVGMVFAGGCVSGSLFKATEGRIPSILAVTGIVVGMAVGMSRWGRTAVAYLAEIGSAWDLSPNLAATDGASHSHLTTGIALIGLAVLGLVFRRRLMGFKIRGAFRAQRGWPLFGVAIVIGLLGWAAFLTGPAVGRHYPLGASHIPGALLGIPFYGEVQLAGLLAWPFLLGSAFSAWMRGEMKRRSAPVEMLVLAFAGGVMVGFGGIMARGCFIGQVLSGWPLLATQALIFGVVLILSNWVTTLFYLRGWK